MRSLSVASRRAFSIANCSNTTNSKPSKPSGLVSETTSSTSPWVCSVQSCPLQLPTPANYCAFLILPCASLILGWTYLVNDEKIGAIGRYIRLTLVEKVKEKTGHADVESLFGWEIAHRSDRRRSRRKIEQLIVDEITFVVSGIIALISFWALVPGTPLAINILGGLELLLLPILGWEIIVCADLAKGR